MWTIELKPNCSITTDSQFIAPTFTHNQGNQSSNVVTRFITNLGILQHFFDNETLKTMNGQTLLIEEPKISLPPFKFFEHKISEKFAQDKKIKIDLEKAAEAVRTDGVILNSLSEAIVTGSIITVSDSFWFSTAGFVVEVSGGVILMLFLNVCYLLFRVRQLAITVLVLQAHILKVQADQPVIFNYFNQGRESVGTNSTEASSSSPLHTIIVYTTIKLWPYVLACLVGIALILFLSHKVWKNMCRKLELNMRFDFMLEFSANQRSIFVPLAHLYGNPADFRVAAEDFIRDIRIEGFLCPKLKFIWETLYLTDRATGEKFTIKTSHNLAWRQAYGLRKKLLRPYLVLPVFVRENQLTRIDIIRTSAPPADVTSEIA